jgi:hypothetical protein
MLWRLQIEMDASGGGHTLDDGLQRQAMALRQCTAILVLWRCGDNALA